MNPPDIVVATCAYGTEFVWRHGQNECIPIVAGAGAQGIEIRRELFLVEQLKQLIDLASAIVQVGLFSVYSAPVGLFDARGEVNVHELPMILDEARMLNARFLKLALGGFQPEFSRAELASFLRSNQMKLLVENDQTISGGRIDPLKTFFSACQAPDISVRMTFDIGNWYWVGEDPLVAAREFHQFVDYVHVKPVRRTNGQVMAVPLEESDGSWLQILKLLPSEAPRGIEFPIPPEEFEKRTREYVTQLKCA